MLFINMSNLIRYNKEMMQCLLKFSVVVFYIQLGMIAFDLVV